MPLSAGKVHPVFHISLLEQYSQNKIPDRRTPTPPPVDIEENIWEIESILSSRVRRKKVEYLVKWVGYGPDENTWEPYEHLTDGAEDSVKEFHLNNPGKPRDPRALV